MRSILRLLSLLGAVVLAGCDLLGLDGGDKLAALREADGKAIGSACRHAGRAIEDCYLLHAKAQRAAVFAGWREMDEYMRENKLEPVAPSLARPVGRAAADAEEEAPPAAAEEPRGGKPKGKATST